MKTIPSRELQTNLDAVLNRSQTERLVIFREGKPCAVLVGIEDYDAEDVQLATSTDFWRMIRQRRSEGRSVPLSDVEARLANRRAKSTGRGPATRKECHSR
jgi:prevent-host-death family protein